MLMLHPPKAHLNGGVHDRADTADGGVCQRMTDFAYRELGHDRRKNSNPDLLQPSGLDDLLAMQSCTQL